MLHGDEQVVYGNEWFVDASKRDELKEHKLEWSITTATNQPVTRPKLSLFKGSSGFFARKKTPPQPDGWLRRC